MESRDSFSRNTLDVATSPYLLQHAGHPVWWQEWSREVLDHALVEDKPLLVSSGYSTCHWCHVMAAGAFSDPATAGFLNQHFVCIKIDREQRPDIDQVLMQFMQEQNGHGGWPLNVFLTPGGDPFFALTYAPVREEGGRISFLEVAQQIIGYYRKHGRFVQPFAPGESPPPVMGELPPVDELARYYDEEYGGFGRGQKFPPHSTLLFLLYRLAAEETPLARTISIETLDAMQRGGLHDHLQGGFFRYCVDRRWTIPHFEKMLYDQVMALWVFALAFKVLEREEYRTTAEKILLCLEETFEREGFYITAYDADTGHEEGATYLWSYRELQEALSPEEFSRLKEIYLLTEEGNFEGRNHLVRRPFQTPAHPDTSPLSPEPVVARLLALRKQRPQPSCDEKVLSGLNALAATALIQAGRLMRRPDLEEKGENLVGHLLATFWDGNSLGHSAFRGEIQRHAFLTDTAALLLAVTLLAETRDGWDKVTEELTDALLTFREEGRWMEARSEDFRPVEAAWFDHPTPSGVSLAEMALTRTAILRGNDYPPAPYYHPSVCGFLNINALIRNGEFHIITTLKTLRPEDLPAHTIQKRGSPETDCFRGTCRLYP